MAKIRFLSEEPLKDDRHLQLLPYLTYGYSKLGKGLVVYEAGDYYTVRGLRAPGGRLRPATAAILRAEKGLRSSAQ